jgi:DNA polymerase I-like protein with 3'-5' exonuclease and polymerase domains
MEGHMTNKPLKFISFDLETSGTRDEYALQPWRVQQKERDMLFAPEDQTKAFITTWAYCYRSGNKPIASGFIGPQINELRKLLRKCIDKGYRIGGWNITYDVSCLIAHGLEEEVFKAEWIDGMLLWRHYFREPEYGLDRSKKKPYTLEAYGNEFVPELSGWKDDVDYHNPSPKARKKLLKYNKNDVIVAWDGIDRFWNLLTPRQQRCALIEADSIPLIAKANLEGMIVDTDAAKALDAKLKARENELCKQLAPYGINGKVANSNKQLGRILFDKWGLPSVRPTDSGKGRSTAKDVLYKLSLVDPRVKLVSELRNVLDRSLIETTLESAKYNEDGRTRPQARMFGAYTGRIQYSSKTKDRQTGFAIQQMKREADFRKPIIPPPGYKLLEFDAAGQEFKFMAIASRDDKMLSLCVPGEDPHSYMAAQILAMDYDEFRRRLKAGNKTIKQDRQLGKLANLSLQYRTSAKKLLENAEQPPYEISMNLDEAKHIRHTYLNSYPGVPAYWDRQIYLTQQRGYVETFAGRRVKVEGDWGNEDLAWSMGSTAINFRVQGTGADQKLLALSVLKRYCVKHDILFAWDLHDGIYYYAPEQLAEKAAVAMKAQLDKLPYPERWGFSPPIPLHWDAKIGPSWGELVELDNYLKAA